MTAFMVLLGVLVLSAANAPAGDPHGAYYSPDNDKIFWFIQVTDLHIGTSGSQDSVNLSWLVSEGKEVVNPEFIVVSGDLTDSTNGNWLGLPNGPYQAEWDEYRSILSQGGINLDSHDYYYDLPGNHDAYNDQYFDYYRANSIQGQATGSTQISWTRDLGFGTYHFLGVNTADNTGDAFSIFWPYGDYAGLDTEELTFIQENLDSNINANLTFVFGHHPVTATGDSQDTWLYYGAQNFVSLLDQYSASLYGYGHTHRYSEVLFQGDDYTGYMTGGGIVYLNVDSLGKSTDNQFSIIAVDCNGVSTKTQAIGVWPLVLITTPVDQNVGGIANPYSYEVPDATDNPLRALVFDAGTISGVKYRIDGESLWHPMEQVANNPYLWEATWDGATMSDGEHTIEVQAIGTTTRSDTIVVYVASANQDTTPPIPNPMTWVDPPQAVSGTSITMTATTATDPSGVEYYFTCVTGGCKDSGWQSGAVYTDTGLLPGSTCGYVVRARDMSPNQNETGPSDVVTATTPAATNVSPTFTSDPIVEIEATEGVPYVAVLSDNATDPDTGDTLTFSKIDGPSWLTIASDGGLTGTPSSQDVGPNSFTVQVSDASGATDTATLSIMVNAAAETYFNAQAETTLQGTVVGSYINTLSDDGVTEALTEVVKAGKWSVLDHTWAFAVSGGASVEFLVQAHHSQNTEGDHFVFSYSFDNVTFTDMLVVQDTFENTGYQRFDLPAYTSGTVYVRVKDTDGSRGNTQLDTLWVDHMSIVTRTAGGLPGAASAPSPVDGATGVITSPELTWSPGTNTEWHEVYFGTESTSLPLVSGPRVDPQYAPGTLQVGTTYFWRIDESNSMGTTTGAQWRFATAAGACTPSTVAVDDILTVTLKGPAGTSYGKAIIAVVDNCGSPVVGALVSGQFTGDFEGEAPQQASTDANGQAEFVTSSALKKPTFGFIVTSVIKDGLTYVPNSQ
jgi:hypothetical protein